MTARPPLATSLSWLGPQDYFFDPDLLTEGAPPNDRGCRACGKVAGLQPWHGIQTEPTLSSSPPLSPPQIGHLVADCPRKKAADSRKRQEKDRRERQGQDRVRERQRSNSEQEQGRRPGNVVYTHRQQKEKIKSLEKWKKKNGSLAKEEEELLRELMSKARLGGKKERKKRKEEEAEEMQKKSFETAVKNVGSEVKHVEKATLSPLQNKKLKEVSENKGKQEEQQIAQNKSFGKAVMNDVSDKDVEKLKRLKKEIPEDKLHQATSRKSSESSMWPVQEGDEGGNSNMLNKPTVQESLNNIRLRKEMKKQASILDAKSPRKPKERSQEKNTDTIKEFRKKQSKKEKQEQEKVEESVTLTGKEKQKVKVKGKGTVKATVEEAVRVSDPDTFDYNTVKRRVVEAGGLDYFAPLASGGDGARVASEPTEQKDTVEKDEIALGMNRKEKRKLKVKANREKKNDKKRDKSLTTIAENYLHVKDCQDAERKFHTQN